MKNLFGSIIAFLGLVTLAVAQPTPSFSVTANSSGTVVAPSNFIAANNIVVTTNNYANPSWLTSLSWSKVTSTPTNLAGYGITDPVVLTTGSYVNPSWIASLSWSKIYGTPTTASAYGITNGAVLDSIGAAPQTGSGSLVFSNSPALVTPNIGSATATSVNGLKITSTTGTITLAGGKTLTTNNTLTLSATDNALLNIGNGGTLGSAAYTAASAYDVSGAASAVSANSLQKASNLSDLTSASTARTNLGVTATGSDTTYAYRANNLSDLTSAATARSNLGLGTAATTNSTAYDAAGAASTAQAYAIQRANHTGTQPASTITGLATSATTDTTNASNITSGTLPNARLSSVPNSALANSSVTVTAGSGLSGGGIVSLGGTVSISANVTSVAGRTGSVTLSSGDISGLAASATTDTTNASNITSGTLPNARLSSVPNSALANSTITIAGNSTALGGSVSQDSITGLSSTGIVKRTAANTLTTATADTDYTTPSGTETLTNKTISGASNTLSNIGNLSLTNSSVSVVAGSGLSGGGSVSLGGSTTLTANVTSVAGRTGAVTILSSDVSGLAASATTDTTNASNITSGTLPNTRLSSVPNTALANSSINVIAGSGLSGGGNTSLGSSVTLAANVTSVAGRTGTVTISSSDVSGLAASATTDTTNATNITSGTLPNARLANNSITVSAGTGLSGGGTVALGGTTTLSNAGVTSVIAGTGVTVNSSTGSVTINATGTGGTVTNLSVTGNSGVLAGVTTPTTTPSISIGLGNITPTSVTTTGNVSGNVITGLYGIFTANNNSSNYTNGTVVVTGGVGISGLLNLGGYEQIITGSTGNSGSNIGLLLNNNTPAAGYLPSVDWATNTGLIWAAINGYRNGGGYGGSLFFQTMNSGGSTNEVMRLDQAGNLDLGTTSAVATGLTVGQTTASTSTTTGSIVTAGGIGVGGNAYVGGAGNFGGAVYSPVLSVIAGSYSKGITLSGDGTSFQFNGKLIAFSDNTYDIGYSSNSYRFRNLFLGGTIVDTNTGLGLNLSPSAFSQSAWGTAGALSQENGTTVTDSSTAASGTATSEVFHSFATPTLAATNTSVTTTDAANVYIAGGVTAGTNQTITNNYGLWNGGNTRIDGNLYLGNPAGSNSFYFNYLSTYYLDLYATNSTNSYLRIRPAGSSGNFGFSISDYGTESKFYMPSASAGSARISNYIYDTIQFGNIQTTLNPNGSNFTTPYLSSGVGILLDSKIFTLTDSGTAASGTLASQTTYYFAPITLAATNTGVTTTDAATVRISGNPTAGTNETITNSWGLLNQGNTRLDGNVKINSSTASSSTTSGALQVAGGVGIGGSAFVGGNVNAGGSLVYSGGTLGGTSDIYSGLGVFGDSSSPYSTHFNAYSLQFGTGSNGARSTRMYIDNGGNVGVGITSPDAVLSVRNPSATGNQTVFDIVGAGSAVDLFGIQANQTTDVVSLGTIYSGQLAFIQNNTERMRINGSGNVGIGTTSPSSLLDVHGDVRAYAFGDNNGFLGYSGSTHIMSFTRLVNSGRLSAFDSLMFYTNATSGVSSGSERMRIDSSGNVGIGTSSPTTSLQINNNGTYATSGNMNTGTIVGNGSGGVALNSGAYDTSTTATSYAWFNSGYDNNAGVGVPMVFATGGIERFRAGTNSTSSSTTSGALQVAGGVGIQGSLWVGPSSGNGYVNTYRSSSSTGQVGYTWNTGATTNWVNYLAATSNDLAWYSSVPVGGATVMYLSSYGAFSVYNYDSSSPVIKTVQEQAGNYAQAVYAYNNGGSYYFAGFYNPSGTPLGSIISNGTITSYNTTSDKRLKSPLRSWSLGDKFDDLPIGEFTWKESGVIGHGTLAQELYKVYPDAVSKGDDGAMPDPKKVESLWQVDYGKLTVPVIAEVKALRARVKTLEQEQADTQKQLNDLTDKFNQYISTHP